MTLTRRRFLQLGVLSTAGVALGSTSYVSRSNELEVTRTAIDLPGDGPDFTMVVVSDVHAPQPFLDFDAVVSAANGAHPDIVVIVGDAINERDDEGLVEMYAPLQARLGKFAVPGNWENWGRVRRSLMRTHYARAGTVWMDNDATDIPEIGVHLVGLDEHLNGWTEWSLIDAAPVDRAAIVLHHSPAVFDRLPLPEGASALMLAGHSHGGQVAPFGFPLVLPPGCGRYIQGRFDRGPHRLYVSRGIGNSHAPFRVGARPELAILDIQRNGTTS